jgi:hypothetical protein
MTTVGAVAGVAAGCYGAWAALAFARYGGPYRRRSDERDALLDEFMSRYDVYERQAIVVNAPPDMTLAAARNQDLLGLPLVKAIFTTRALVMGSSDETPLRRQGLLAATAAMGWRVLEEIPDREIVVGAVTKPWQADVTFRGIEPEHFAAFGEPDYVKIVWMLRADPIGAGDRTLFSTETRAVATDDEARRKFRRYWALASPGISMIRRLGLPPLRASAERAAATPGLSRPLSEPSEQPVP